jgi:hypothetical protein
VEVLDRFSPPGVGKSVDSVENTAPKALNAPGRQLLKKASQSFAPAGAKGSQIIFSGDMCVGENTSRPANVKSPSEWAGFLRCSRPQSSRKSGKATFSTVTQHPKR